MPKDVAPAPLLTPQQRLARANANSPFDAQGNFIGGGVWAPDGSFRGGGMAPEDARRHELSRNFFDPDTGKYEGDPQAMGLGQKLIMAGVLGVAGGFALPALGGALFGGGGAAASAGSIPSIAAGTGVTSGIPTAAMGTTVAGSMAPSFAASGVPAFFNNPYTQRALRGAFNSAVQGDVSPKGLLTGAGVGAATTGLPQWAGGGGGGGSNVAASTPSFGSSLASSLGQAAPYLAGALFTGDRNKEGKELQSAQADQIRFLLEQLKRYQPAQDQLFRGFSSRLANRFQGNLPNFGLEGAGNPRVPQSGGAAGSPLSEIIRRMQERMGTTQPR